MLLHALISTIMPFPGNGGSPSRPTIGFSRQLQGEFTVFLLPSCINRRLSERIPDSYYSFS